MKLLNDDMEFLLRLAMLCVMGIVCTISALFGVGMIPALILRLIVAGWNAGWTLP